MSGGTWAAPGRVNLMGEHTDYNDGYVLPIALAQRTVVTAVRSPGRTTIVRSTQQPDEVVTFSAATVEPGGVTGWGAYVAGVVWALRDAGYDVGDAAIVIDSDVPQGAGLSSSAALECAVSQAWSDLFELGVDRTEQAKLAQRAENEYVGMPCGVMDQMAVMHGRAGHALLLDTRSLDVSHVPLDFAAAGLALLVVDTRAPHRLVEGEYAARRADCEEAAKQIGVTALRDATYAQLEGLPERAKKRARHVIAENARVLDTVEILRARRDIREIGPLLTESHVSLRDDFEVTVPETNAAVEALLRSGAHGARITGGGFGGCVIGLVDANRTDVAMETVRSAFAYQGFAAPEAFVAQPSDGAQRLA